MDNNQLLSQAMLGVTADAPATVLFIGYRGSIAHNMYVPGTDPYSIDDVDFMAVTVPPLKHYFGLTPYGSQGTIEYIEDTVDMVAYELRKFITLLMQGNPNVLSMLWLRDEDILRRSPEWDMLLECRSLFVGKHAYETFAGYANDQLKRMVSGQSVSGRGFMGEKRKALRERFGYDTKNAAHLIRILRMGCEVLRTGEMVVYRPDADELLAIKRGAWTLEQVRDEAERLFADARLALAESALPAAPPREEINALCTRMVRSVFMRQGRIG